MKNEIKMGALLGYINIFVIIFSGLIYTPFMLKNLGQSEYGLYSFCSSMIAYLSVLDLGLGNATVRFISKSQGRKDSKEPIINGMFLLLYFIIGIISLIFGIIISQKIDFLFSNSLSNQEIMKGKILMLIMTFNISISFPLSVFESYVIANEKFIILKTLTILKNFLKPIIMIPILLLGFKSISLCIVTTLINLLYYTLILYYCFKKLKMKIKINIKFMDFSLLKEIAAYSFFIFLNIIVDNVFNNTDQIILGAVSGTIAVSIYAVAYQIFQMYTQCSTVISSLFLPRITKTLEQHNADEKISNIFLKVSRIQLYLLLLILSGFIIFGKEFITIWAGKEYLNAYYIVLLLIGPSIIPLTQNIGIPIIQAKNIHQFRSVVYIFIAILNICLSVVLAKKYGAIGVAIGTAVATTLGQILTMNLFYYYKAKIDIKKYWINFLRFSSIILVLVIPFYLIINYFNLNLNFIIIFGFIYVIIYMSICYLYSNEDEKKYINSIIRKARLEK